MISKWHTTFATIVATMLKVSQCTTFQASGTLSCGDSLEVQFFDNSSFWFLDTSDSDHFSVHTCGTYSAFGLDTELHLYTYNGSFSSTIQESNLDYLESNNDFYAHSSCSQQDSNITVPFNAEDIYVLEVDEVNSSFSGSYFIQLDCRSYENATVLPVEGILECDEEVEGIQWDSYYMYWFLDVSEATEDFTVSTCGSYDDYDVDTLLLLYEYDNQTTGQDLLVSYMGNFVGFDDDDNRGYCGQNATFDSAITMNKTEGSDVYVATLADVWDDMGGYYHLALDCDAGPIFILNTTTTTEKERRRGGGGSDSGLEGWQIALIVVLPVLFILLVVFILWRYGVFERCCGRKDYEAVEADV